MQHVVLLACSKDKADGPAPARELYDGTLFRESLAYAETLAPDLILVLSAKHHVVGIDEELEPYDETLRNKSAAKRRRWADEVMDQIRTIADPETDRFTVLAGQDYREYLLPHLKHVEVPLEEVGGYGEQVSWLQSAVDGS